MTDYAMQERGTRVSMATCCDDEYPPSHIIDGKLDTCWVTTGMYPQEVVLTLKSQQRISRVVVKSTGEGCENEKSVFDSIVLPILLKSVEILFVSNESLGVIA